MPVQRGNGQYRPPNKDKTQTTSKGKAQKQPVPFKKPTKPTKPTKSTKATTKPSKSSKIAPPDDFDDEEHAEFEVDGDFDFDSDVEVMDLSAMLDDPIERKNQTRKGGQNKDVKQPGKVIKGKKSTRRLEKGDEDIDSDNDIFTVEDFRTYAQDKESINEPILTSGKQVNKILPKATTPVAKALLTAKNDDADDISDFDDEDINEMMNDSDFSGTDDDDDDETMGDDEGDESYEEDVEMNTTAFDDDQYDDDNQLDFGGLENDNNNDEADEDNTNLSSIDALLSRMSNRDKGITDKSREQELRELTLIKRRKGELFSNKDQIGDKTINVGLANLNQGINKLAQPELEPSSEDLFSLSASSAPTPTPKTSTPLSVSSLLQSLRVPTATSNASKISLLDKLRAPSLRNLTTHVAHVEAQQEKQLLGSSLGDVARGRLEREQYYKDKSVDISKFQGIVHHNRGLQTLNLKTQQKTQKINMLTSQSMTQDFHVTNELEQDLDSIYDEIGRDQFRKSKQTKDGQLASAGKEQTLEELEEATKYASKMKIHALFEQKRAARISKIKSRAQRKYIRAQGEKLQNNKLLDKPEGLTPQDLERLELEFEKSRIKERTLLTHKNTSKWAKRQKRFAAKVDHARQLLNDQLQLGVQLRKKLGHKEQDDDGMGLSSDDDGDNDSDFDPDDEEAILKRQIAKLQKASTNNASSAVNQSSQDSGMKKSKGSGLLHLPFMRRAQEELARKNDDALIQLKKDLQLSAEYGDSDDEDTQQKIKNLSQQASEAKTKAEKQQLENKIHHLKKQYGPTNGKKTTSSAYLDSLAQPTGNDNDEDTRAIDATLSGPSLTGKMSTMFGGVFDIDDDETTSSIQSNLALPSLKAQQDERTRILNAMKQTAGKSTTLDFFDASDSDSYLQSNSDAISVASNSNAPKRLKVDPSTSKLDGEDIFGNDNMDDIFATADDNVESNPWLNSGEQTTSKTSKKKGVKTTNIPKLDLSTSVLLTDQIDASTSITQSNKNEPKEKKSKTDFGQNDLVSLAFSSAVNGDEEFTRQKLIEMEETLPQYDDNATVAGWGSWAGVKKTPQQIRRENEILQQKHQQIKIQRSQLISSRSDAHLNNVIINQKQDKSARKYQIHNIPYPFTSIEEYQASLRVPLGREWNTGQGYMALNKPKVIVNTGQVVQALKWNESMHGYAKDGSVKNDANVPRSSRDYDEYGQPIIYEDKTNKTRKQPPSAQTSKDNKRQRVKK